jgi:hypothetical protein
MWDCGPTGPTERQLCADSIVTFDKIFEFSIHFHFDRHQMLKSKILKLGIFRSSPAPPMTKTFAAADVDRLPYTMSAPLVSSRLELTSQQKCTAIMNVTIYLC